MPKLSVNRIMPMVFFIKYYTSSYKYLLLTATKCEERKNSMMLSPDSYK